MKYILLIFWLNFFHLTLFSQCIECNTNVFKSIYQQPKGTPNQLWSENSNLSVSKDSLEIITAKIKNSLSIYYSNQFADSCKIKKIVESGTSNNTEFGYRIVFLINLNSATKYQFCLDFNKDGSESYFDFPVIEDSLLFNSKNTCCNVINIVMKDKIQPIKKVERIILCHFVNDNNLNGFYWFVYGDKLKPQKNGIIKQKVKIVDFSTNQIVKRDYLLFSNKTVIIDEGAK